MTKYFSRETVHRPRARARVCVCVCVSVCLGSPPNADTHGFAARWFQIVATLFFGSLVDLSCASLLMSAAAPALPAATSKKGPPVFVVCKECPVAENKRHRPGGKMFVDGEEVAVRTGRVQHACAVCHGATVDAQSGMCYTCERVRVSLLTRQ